MRKALVNYWVDMVTAVAFQFCVVTGSVHLFPSMTVSISSGGQAMIFGVGVVACLTVMFFAAQTGPVVSSSGGGMGGDDVRAPGGVGAVPEPADLTERIVKVRVAVVGGALRSVEDCVPHAAVPQQLPQ